MTQRLRTVSAVLEDPSSVLSIPVGRLQLCVISVPGNMTPSSLCGHSNTHMHTRTYHDNKFGLYHKINEMPVEV